MSLTVSFEILSALNTLSDCKVLQLKRLCCLLIFSRNSMELVSCMGFERLITVPIFEVPGAKLFFPKVQRSGKAVLRSLLKALATRFSTAASHAFDFLA